MEAKLLKYIEIIEDELTDKEKADLEKLDPDFIKVMKTTSPSGLTVFGFTVGDKRIRVYPTRRTFEINREACMAIDASKGADLTTVITFPN